MFINLSSSAVSGKNLLYAQVLDRVLGLCEGGGTKAADQEGLHAIIHEVFLLRHHRAWEKPDRTLLTAWDKPDRIGSLSTWVFLGRRMHRCRAPKQANCLAMSVKSIAWERASEPYILSCLVISRNTLQRARMQLYWTDRHH